jgi:hypothetical protein
MVMVTIREKAECAIRAAPENHFAGHVISEFQNMWLSC